MARPRRTAPRGRYRELSFSQRFDLTCGHGQRSPGSPGSAWETEAERRRAWEEHRDELMTWPQLSHSRPFAFWHYEPGVPAELRDRESYASLETAADEALALDEARWRWLESTGKLIEGESEAIAEERQHRRDVKARDEQIRRQIEASSAAYRAGTNGHAVYSEV